MSRTTRCTSSHSSPRILAVRSLPACVGLASAALASGVCHAQWAGDSPFFGEVGFTQPPSTLFYGFAVSASEEFVAVAEPNATVGATANAGKVHITRSADGITTTLVDGTTGVTYFGSSLSVRGSVLVVGTPSGNATPAPGGKASIFEFVNGAWLKTATLAPVSPQNEDYFGGATAIDSIESRVFVSAPLDNTGLTADHGSVSVYEKSGANWSLTGTITAAPIAANAQFGSSLAVDGNRLAVGAIGETQSGFAAAGAAYIFELNGGSWAQVARITAPTASASENFGASISLEGDTLAVGAPTSFWASPQYPGAVYIYKKIGSSWVHARTIRSDAPSPFDRFGRSVELRNGKLIIGGRFASGAAVMVYEDVGGAWTRVARVASVSSTGANELGTALAWLDDHRFIASAPYAAGGGAVVTFRSSSAANIDHYLQIDANEMSDAALLAQPNDRILLRSNAFNGVGTANLSTKPLQLRATESVTIGADMLVRLADGSSITDEPGTGEHDLVVAGDLVSPTAGTVTFDELTTVAGGQFLLNGATMVVNRDFATTGGRSYLKGQILAESVSTSGAGQHRVAGDVDCFADYNNAGTTIIQRGVLYIYGSLVNTGTLTGEYDLGFLPPTPGDGYSIGGDYIVGADASLILPDAVWRLGVGRDLDIAINDPARFSMAVATIEMTGLSKSAAQSFEAMSANLGAVDAGFAATNYPIGTLRIAPGSTTTIVDRHDNAEGSGGSKGACEVVYAKRLEVPAGATLVTSGCPIYVREAAIAGTVSDASDIVIVPEAPACPGDVDGDGDVDAADLSGLLIAWGSANAGGADVNRDGQVTAADLSLLLVNWGACD
ncbi:MAG: FG-GAP repeat protein [Limnohabitans sp.]|nr:FG-GAP repeat protein [Limnohabitans sp.]